MVKVTRLTRASERINSSVPTKSTVEDPLHSAYESGQGLGELFLNHLKDIKSFQAGWQEECNQWQQELKQAIQQDNRSVEDRGGSFRAYLKDGGTQRQHELLEQLRFPEMTDRDDRIPEAYERTFSWIFRDQSDSSWVNFVDWLETGSGTYWITGKPGSGKSTLMKYICTDERTYRHLTIWASSVPLVSAAFYFWNSGAQIQMSERGLLRSLLFQILSKAPELSPRLFPERWEVATFFRDLSSDWSKNELRTAWTRLMEVSKFKFCIFVDGLDEFSGDHLELINLLRESSKHIKICAASRPWNVFEEAFKLQPSLLLQALTHSDIVHFVSSMFHGDAYFADLQEEEPHFAKELLDGIVEKAAGVFLWVHLVVRSLLSGLRNGDRIVDLQMRLDLLPPDLEDLYQKILDSIDPFYFEHAFQYFQLVRSTSEPLSLLTFSFADEAANYVLDCPVEPLGHKNRVYRAETMRRRLNSRCKGLLEVASAEIHSESPTQVKTLGTDEEGGNRTESEESLDLAGDASSETREGPPPLSDGTFAARIKNVSMAESTVQYLHRTVKDFLEDPEVWTRLEASSKAAFNPQVALCRSYIIQMKVGSYPSYATLDGWSTVAFELKRCVLQAHVCEKACDESFLRQEFISMLDEFDRAAMQVTSKIFVAESKIRLVTAKTSPIFAGHWTLLLAGATPSVLGLFRGWETGSQQGGYSFLSLAVGMDLYHYVDAKVHLGCLEKQSSTVWPLLIDAVSDQRQLRICFEDSAQRGDDFSIPPSPKMVHLLLSKSANPNYRIGKSTIWNQMLRMLYHVSRSELPKGEMASRWLPVILDFLDHGADTSVNFTAYLEKLFKYGNPALVDEIRARRTKPWISYVIGEHTQSAIHWALLTADACIGDTTVAKAQLAKAGLKFRSKY